MFKIAVGIGGASGSIYAKTMLDRLRAYPKEIEVSVVMSDNAKFNWEYELGNKKYDSYPFRIFSKNDFMAPFASGSARYDAVVICPCSMGQIGRIANGISTDLIGRAADVQLKENRKLVLVPRETPYSLIHVRNMEQVILAGGVICPATPSFYSHPTSMEELAATVSDRALQLAGLKIDSFRWGA